jgi:outer membrane protein OmpA-like peptidoglycan-associated protein
MKRALLLVALLAVAACAQQPPPPPAAPMPAAAHPTMPTYIVYFDWNSSRIGPAGYEVLRHAAAAYHAGHPVHVTVTGFTDRSGSARYNERLSKHRAWHVAWALRHLGIPRSAIIVQARGENDNRVPTANGVREPQNRRVEIVEG